ncbi:MAG: glycosyltransferase [Desulfovibrionaceae bacterium]|nr:glycosyltransferase [Desulfovibrionaceae bacterium]
MQEYALQDEACVTLCLEVADVTNCAHILSDVSKAQTLKQIICYCEPHNMAEVQAILQDIHRPCQLYTVADLTLSWIHYQHMLHAKHGHYVCFVESCVNLRGEQLDLLVNILQAHPKLLGVNPLFIDESRANKSVILSQGIVFDSELQMHYLWAGFEVHQVPSKSLESIQLADSHGILLAEQDLEQLPAQVINIPGLGRQGLLLALRTLYPERFFAVAPQILVGVSNPYSFIQIAALWNSYVHRGRLGEVVTSDYMQRVQDAGYIYGADDWLVVGPRDCLKESTATACMQHPVYFWQWFTASIKDHPQEQASLLELIRGYPALLPQSFAFYQSRYTRLKSFAESHNLPRLLEDLKSFKRYKFRFHAKLRQFMRALERLGVYHVSLAQCQASYAAWVELGENVSKVQPALSVQEHPSIGVLMPIWRPERNFLEQALNSVLRQDYQNWQLCLVDDGSKDAELTEYLVNYQRQDARIKLTTHAQNKGIAAATMTALSQAETAYVTCVDQDDELAPYALGEVAKVLEEKKQIGFLYSDEDHIDSYGVRRTPIFRHAFAFYDFCPGHLNVFAKDLVEAVGGWRSALDGAQDRDLALRVAERLKTEEIMHLPKILYHWRVHPKSSAGSVQAKDYVDQATEKVLLQAWQRRAQQVELVATSKKTFYRVKLNGHMPSVGLILWYDRDKERPSNDLLKCTQIKFENIHHVALQTKSLAQAINKIAKESTAEIIWVYRACLIPKANSDLRQLVYLAALPDIGLVGGTLWQENYVWHTGLVPSEAGAAFPQFYGLEEAFFDQVAHGSLLLDQQTLAPDWACFAVQREHLIGLKGLDPEFGADALTDLGLRFTEHGLTNLIAAWAHLLVPKDYGTPNLAAPNAAFANKWTAYLQTHPLRNAQLVRAGYAFRLAF